MSSIQYGPYSPQEMDRIAQWVQAKSLKFEILRNDQEAKEGLMNDSQNVVRLADFRTGIYLAQIFYINIFDLPEDLKNQFEEKFSLPTESFASFNDQKKSAMPESDYDLKTKAWQHGQRQRSWATWLVVAILVSLFLGYFFKITI